MCAEGKGKQGRAGKISGGSAVVGQGEFRQLALAMERGAGREDVYLLGIQASLVGLGLLARVRTGPNPHGVSGTGK